MINFTVTTDEATGNIIIDALQDRVDKLRKQRYIAIASLQPQQQIWCESKIESLEKAIKDMQDTAVKA